jgi:RHO1 GDP-GTP exchange protein 1/2
VAVAEKKFERLPAARRRDVEAFQRGPINRLSKYSLLVKQILENTDPNSQDRELLEQASSYIDEQVKQVSEAQSEGKKEAKRQFNINELIDGEREYYKDLDFVEKGFIEKLKQADPPIISPSRVNEFLKTLFYNISELRDLSLNVLDAFLARQREQTPLIREIGDTLLPYLPKIGEAYTKYVSNSPFSTAILKEETANNEAFATFAHVSVTHSFLSLQILNFNQGILEATGM